MKSTKTCRCMIALSAIIAIYAAAGRPGFAADTPVSVTNTTANPVPTSITNTSAAPVPAVIYNNSRSPIPTSITNTTAIPTSITNTTASPVPTSITNTTAIPTSITNTSAAPVPTMIYNNSRSPVLTKASDDPGRNAKQYEIAWFSGTSGGFTETSTITIPAGKTYAIEGISCEAYAPSSTEVMIKMITTAGGSTMTHYITGFKSSLIYTNYWMLGFQPISIYADPSTNITVDVVRQTPPGSSIGYYSDVILSGHYVVVP